MPAGSVFDWSLRLNTRSHLPAVAGFKRNLPLSQGEKGIRGGFLFPTKWPDLTRPVVSARLLTGYGSGPKVALIVPRELMTTKDKETANSKAGTRGKPTTGAGVWSGDAVARAPGGQAEAEALRAEGKAPAPLREVLKRNATDVDSSARKPPETKRQSDEDNEASQKLKQEAAAEEHREVQSKRGTGPHGRL